MKKSLVFLGIVLVSFGSVALASPLAPLANKTELGYKIGTPLCMAISKGDVATVRKFIEYGVDVNETSNGMTPLMVAARYNNVEIMKLLIDNGADVNAKSENGYNALKFAQLSNASAAVAYLGNTTSKK